MRLDSKIFDSLFLVGPMGSGKTTIGKQLARELALKFVDSDHEVEIRAGADITWIFDVDTTWEFEKWHHAIITDAFVIQEHFELVLKLAQGFG